jgi:protein-disulfide isomerase
MDPLPSDAGSPEPLPTPLTTARSTAPARYRTRPYHVHAAFLPLLFLIGLGVGYLIWDKPASAAAPAAPAAPVAAATTDPKTVKRYAIPISESDPSFGPQDAPVTLIMFSDYQCPYCKKWYGEVFKTLVSDYQGKIRFVYKDFPLYSLHSDAEPAAEAARCSGEQGKYWEFQDLLFTSPDGLSAAAYHKYSLSLGLDATKFDDCVSTHRYQKQVEADYQFAANLGVQSTPTFFINGLAVVGAQPLEVFQQQINQELAGKVN